MKHTFICLLAGFAALTGALQAAPLQTTEITASGSGSVSLPPDLAMLDASVETNSVNAQDAIAENNARYDRIVGRLAQMGVARADIALSYYNVSYNARSQNPLSNGERYGYTVSRSFIVKVRQIGSAGRVSDACIAAGATAINGVTFGLSDPSVARARATQAAVTQARSNAQALASATGLRIVSIKSIELEGTPGPMPLMRAAAASAPTQFDQSNVNVTVSVNVVFLARP